MTPLSRTLHRNEHAYGPGQSVNRTTSKTYGYKCPNHPFTDLGTLQPTCRPSTVNDSTPHVSLTSPTTTTYSPQAKTDTTHLYDSSVILYFLCGLNLSDVHPPWGTIRDPSYLVPDQLLVLATVTRPRELRTATQ